MVVGWVHHFDRLLATLLRNSNVEGMEMTMDPEQLKRLNDTCVKVLTVVRESGMTGDEYLLLLQLLVAQVLSENPKQIEKIFLERVRQDVLNRRLNKLKAAGVAGEIKADA